jgi:hypothetical protein
MQARSPPDNYSYLAQKKFINLLTIFVCANFSTYFTQFC